MPAKSKEQQRLMGLAWAVRKGKLDRSKVSKAVLDIADGKMSDKDLKDFASTKHNEIKEDYNRDYLHTIIQDAAEKLGVNLDDYNMDQLHIGMNVELEHGSRLGNITNITDNNPVDTLSIVIAHLKENPNYYTDPLPKDWGKNESNNRIGEPTFPRPPKPKKDVDESLTPSAVSGMGDIGFPGQPGATTSFSSQTHGSGDAPAGPIKKKKKKRIIEYFDDYIKSRNYMGPMKHIVPYSAFIDKEENENDDERFRAIDISTIETSESLKEEFNSFEIDIIKEEEGLIELDNGDIITYDFTSEEKSLKVNGIEIDTMGNFFDIPSDYIDYKDLD